jgi:hypothetical protein
MIPVGGRNFVHGRSTTRVRGGLATSWPQFINPAGIAAIVRGARAQLGEREKHVFDLSSYRRCTYVGRWNNRTLIFGHISLLRRTLKLALE